MINDEIKDKDEIKNIIRFKQSSSVWKVGQDEIEILYNGCHGGWGISDKAVKLYNSKKLEIDPSWSPILDGSFSSLDEIERHDKILIQIYHELGDKMNGRHSCIRVCAILKEYEKYYDIDEYDGWESVNIDIAQYKYDTLKSTMKDILIDDTISSDDKISKLTTFLNL